VASQPRAGLPVLTCAGDRHAARVGASLLHTVGLDDFVTKDSEAYVEAACHWASRINELAVLRGNLRRRLLDSPLCKPRHFVRDFEAELQAMHFERAASQSRL
jgi:predicted O-linked N-acetylglucosamine transferase (SPINDLY family)